MARPFAVGFEILAVLVVLVLGAALLLEGRRLPVPQALAERMLERAEAAIGADLGVRSVTLEPRGNGLLVFRAEEVRLAGAAEWGGSAEAILLPSVEAEFDLGALMSGARAPKALVVEGASLNVVRHEDGQFDLGLATAGDPVEAGGATASGTRADLIAGLRALLARPELAPLNQVTFSGVSLSLDDRRSRRPRKVSNGRIELQRGGGQLSAVLSAEIPTDGADARLSLRATLPEVAPEPGATGNAGGQVSALVEGVPAREIADEIPPLGWLAALDAPVSGALIAELDAEGRPGRFDGTLDLGPGMVAPGSARAIQFDEAQAYFSFRPETSRLNFDRLRLASVLGEIEASGHAYLSGLDGGRLDQITAQLDIGELHLDLPEALPAPVTFDGGQIEARIALAPLRAEIGQIVLTTEAPEPLRLSGRGHVAVRGGHWQGSADLTLSEIGPRTLLALWPYQLVPRTRDWLERNLLDGRLSETRAGLVLQQGAAPEFGLTFNFREAVVQALRGAPPVTGGAGHSSIIDSVFTLTLAEGIATPPEGGPIDLSGGVVRIPDVRLKPPDGEILWRSESSITAVLSLLDQPPFELISKSGRPVRLAEGRAALTGVIRFPMGRGLTVEKVAYDLDGVLRDVRSDQLVPDRVLEAETLSVSATPRGLVISGEAELDGLPLTADWVQPFGSDRPPAEVRARFPIGPEAAEIFGLGLPAGTLSGSAEAEAVLSVPSQGAPTLALTSSLEGLRISLPSLGWSKPAGSSGLLTVEGQLGGPTRPTEFGTVALEAPGLSASGSLQLAAAGGLAALRLPRARIGTWFNGAVTLRGRGAGRAPAVEIGGGRLDMTAAPLADGGGAASSGGPVAVRLDRLEVAEDVALTDLRADLNRSGGLSGQFAGRVNGGPQVTGTLSPGTGGRPTIRLRTEQAGRTLAAAGVFDEARGGTMALTLTPEAAQGTWRGALTVEEIRLTSAPGIATLLNAISVVGLIEQLNGPGLLLSTMRADFRISPGVVQLLEASVVGPSVGISADGLYDLRNERLDVQGVISPIFAINSIGQMFTREGEGLFGFNYRIRGDADDPEVLVNPLSVLTPGAFRQIFRAPPPTLRQGEN